MALEGPKWLEMGSKGAHFTCLGTPNGIGSFLEKQSFLPFFDHFFSQNSPCSRHFGILGRAKMGHHELKTRQKHLFWHSMWSRIIFEKIIFAHPADLAGPFWHPPLWATTCSLPRPTRPQYGGLGVGYGNFKGWKPPKVGGCGWIRCA